MRPLYTLFLLVLCLSGFAQPSAKPFHVDTIDANGLILKKGWRWHAGDNPAWAAPTFDHSRWDTIKPTQRIGKLPQVARAGIGWFRLHFTLDSAYTRETLALSAAMNGAADVYLDGRLFRSFGRVSATTAGEVRYKWVRGSLYLLPPLDAGPHTLAVRFSTHPMPWYVPGYVEKDDTMELTLRRPEAYVPNRVARTHTETLIDYLLVGLFLILSAIHFLYYYFRRQTINLIFGVTTLLHCINNVANDLAPYITSVAAASWADFIGTICSYSFPLMLLATYYLYLNRKHGRVFWATALITALAVLFMYRGNSSRSDLTYLIPRFVLAGSLVVLVADGLRITVVAMRQARTREKASIVLISFTVIIGLLFVGAFGILFVQYKMPAYTENFVTIFGGVMMISLPLIMALLLAKEHDQINSDLQKRLVEVEKLSGEKETILTQQKQMLEEQVAQRTAKLNQSLEELRETQTQLVQREKMASLGELTAGIAHEIQNPLNFVNNFSEVSAELLDELKHEQVRPATERDPQLETELLNDIHQNVLKIGHHGQRAASIVRGMLQHSRASTGERTPTDLNALGDEYLRLSYHGLRAKDKSFNATLHTSLDPALENVTVVAQDIGRVLLNLFNNAFYAVWERAKTADDTYKPTVWLFTRQLEGHVEIRIQDNGNGIPEELQRKIFQPFFTTKPTGQGTGLGLSLSYDIITKGHAGTLSVDTQPGQYTTFIITLPTD